VSNWGEVPPARCSVRAICSKPCSRPVAPWSPVFAPAADIEIDVVCAVHDLLAFRSHVDVLQEACLLACLAMRHRASVLFLLEAHMGPLIYGTVVIEMKGLLVIILFKGTYSKAVATASSFPNG
jgi:hypothetical protein